MFSDFIKIPFVDGGRDYNGCDCWGLVQLVMGVVYDKHVPDYKISCMDFMRIHERMRSEQKLPRWNRLEFTKEPCVVLFRLHKERVINHAGLYIGDGRFIHTIRQHGATITPINHPFFKTRIEGFYEYAG